MTQTCECGCGTDVQAPSRFVRGHVRRGRKFPDRKKQEQHGMSGTPEYAAWHNMISRCLPTCRQYKDWGGRGITVCDEWRQSFTAFFEHIGPRPSPEYTVDRINNDGNYEPGNVRWATRSVQQNNRRESKQ